MPAVVPIGGKWSEKFSLKYSPAQEMLWSLHVLGDPSHHQDLMSWSLETNSQVSSELAAGIERLARDFDQWGVFIELVETLEGEKMASWEQIEAELTGMGQALFVYFALGRSVKVGDLLKTIRQPALVEAFLKAHADFQDPEVVKALLLDPEEIRTRLLKVLKSYWQEHFARELEKLKDYYFSNLQEKVRLLQEQGASGLLESLGLGLYLDEGYLRGEALVGEEIVPVNLGLADVDGIVVMPTIFATPHLLPAYKGKKLFLRYPIGYPQAKANFWEEDEVLGTLKALADGTRLRILEMLAEGPKYTGEIAERLGFSEPTVSRHMQLLKNVCLVKMRKKDNYTYYTLDEQVVKDVGKMVSVTILGH